MVSFGVEGEFKHFLAEVKDGFGEFVSFFGLGVLVRDAVFSFDGDFGDVIGDELFEILILVCIILGLNHRR